MLKTICQWVRKTKLIQRENKFIFPTPLLYFTFLVLSKNFLMQLYLSYIIFASEANVSCILDICTGKQHKNTKEENIFLQCIFMWQNSCITLYLTVLMTKCYESVSHQQTRAQNILDIRRKAKFNIIPHPLEATLNFLSPWEIYLSLLSDCNITMMKQHQQNSNANSTITSEVHETFYVFSSPKNQ